MNDDAVKAIRVDVDEAFCRRVATRHDSPSWWIGGYALYCLVDGGAYLCIWSSEGLMEVHEARDRGFVDGVCDRLDNPDEGEGLWDFIGETDGLERVLSFEGDVDVEMYGQVLARLRRD